MEAWQAQINAYTKQYWNGPDGPKEPIAGPVRLKMDFYLPWPKSAPKKSPDAINRWLLKNYPKRSDIRNMAKAFEDALQTIVYQNDNQVIVAGPDTKGFTTRGEGYTVCTVEKLIPTGV
jgi:Holliday junction resolvase RusA-like endonuclease